MEMDLTGKSASYVAGFEAAACGKPVDKVQQALRPDYKEGVRDGLILAAKLPAAISKHDSVIRGVPADNVSYLGVTTPRMEGVLQALALEQRNQQIVNFPCYRHRR